MRKIQFITVLSYSKLFLSTKTIGGLRKENKTTSITIRVHCSHAPHCLSSLKTFNNIVNKLNT